MWRRWALFGAGLLAPVLPAEWLAVVFGDPARHTSTLLALWGDFLVGPIKYWLAGDLNRSTLHPMAGASTWIYAGCLPFVFAHPVRPHLLTGIATITAFTIWYGWAFLTFVAYNAPC